MSDPFVQAQSQMFDLVKKAGEEQLARLSHYADEAQRIEATVIQNTTAAIAEGAKIVADGLNYAGQLSQEWRKLSLSGIRQAADYVTTAANKVQIKPAKA